MYIDLSRENWKISIEIKSIFKLSTTPSRGGFLMYYGSIVKQMTTHYYEVQEIQRI